MKELYCGVDIHRKNYVGCIVDKNGDIVQEGSFPSTKEGAQSFLCGIPVKAIAIEACSMWRAAMNIFRELGYEVKLTSPKKTKDIVAKKKTDKVDAKALANLLRTGFLHEVYIPTDEMLKLRDIARHKESLTRLRTKVQNKIKSYMVMDGIKYPSKLWSVKGREWLSKIEDPNIQNWLRIYHSFIAEENQTLTKIRKISRARELTNLLMTMPGIGDFSALMIVGEIADINRFETPKQLVMYAGLCPGVYQTGDIERDVKNNAVNKHLKWILTECSGRASIMKGTRFQHHYVKTKKKKGFKVARRSTARKMVTIIWHMLKNKEVYYAS